MPTMTPNAPLVTGGVDTHRDCHVAAAIDPVGGVLGTRSFPTTPGGYRQLLGWLRSFGPLDRVGAVVEQAHGVGTLPARSTAGGRW